MMAMIQVIRMFEGNEIVELRKWMDSIENHDEAMSLVEYLDDMHGIEMAENMAERFCSIILDGRYKAAFNLFAAA